MCHGELEPYRVFAEPSLAIASAAPAVYVPPPLFNAAPRERKSRLKGKVVGQKGGDDDDDGEPIGVVWRLDTHDLHCDGTSL